MPDLWTSAFKREFHTAVEALQKVTKQPLPEVSYRGALPAIDSGHYRLRLRDELQLADHIAYLAHSQEGVQAVSGVCVEELADGLLVRLASNHTPSDSVVAGLQNILRTASDGAKQGSQKNPLQDSIFDEVLGLSQDRILQRIRPAWVAVPAYYHGGEEPLWVRIERILGPFKGTSSRALEIVSRLEDLMSDLKVLESEPVKGSIRELVRTTVRHCARVSYSGGHGSLEQQLQEVPNGQGISARREVVQLDKISRYFGLCKDIAKLVQERKYRSLTQNIALEVVPAYPASTPAGALRPCYVHAEVQLVLFYEQKGLEKPPRAIGCSKSACFLCDTLIQKLGQYHISHTHKRLYSQWTIPDVSWMTPGQVQCFRSVLRSMITQMRSLEANSGTASRGRPQFSAFGIESRAILPLSSNSGLDSLHASSERSTGTEMIPHPSLNRSPSVSELSLALSFKADKVAECSPTPTEERRPNTSLVSIDLSKDDLPYQREVRSLRALYLQLKGLYLIFDCSSVRAGSLHIREVANDQTLEHGVRCFHAFSIPTAEIELERPSGSSGLRFRLRVSELMAVDIEVAWAKESSHQL